MGPDGAHGRRSSSRLALAGQPARVGAWELTGKLGQGTFGVVYEARRAGDPRRYALKLLVAGEAEDQARFAREVELMAQVDHPGLVRVFDAGRLGAQPYFVMELVAGETLKQRLRRGSFSPDEAARLVQELAMILAAVHARGIVHRDLKPSNVILDHADGRARVTDFGLGRALGSTGRLTHTGDQLGTPLYMAPELFQDAKRAGPPVDVWALGAILYECLCGRPPYLNTRLVDQARSVQESDPVPPRALRPEVSPALEQLCLRALARDPRERPDALALAAALRGLPLAAAPAAPAAATQRRAAWPAAPGAEPGALPALPAPAPIRSGRLLAAGGLVALGCAGGVAILLARPGARPERAVSPAPAPEPVVSAAAPPPAPGSPPAPAPIEPLDPLRAAQERLSQAASPEQRARAARQVIGLLQARGRAEQARQVALSLVRPGEPFAPEAALRAAWLAIHSLPPLREQGVSELRALAADPAAGASGLVARAVLQPGYGRRLDPAPLEQALAAEPDLGPASWYLAVAVLPEQPARALQVLEEGLRRTPEDASLLWQLINARQQRRELDEADRALERLIALGGEEADFEAFYQRARDELNRDRQAAALPWLDRALRREPGNLIALLMRGVCRWNTGQAELASADWRQAVLGHGLEPFLGELERRYRQPELQTVVRERLFAALCLRLPLRGGPAHQAWLAQEAQAVPRSAREPLLAALRAAGEGAPWARLEPLWARVREVSPGSVPVALREAQASIGRDRLQEAAQALARARQLGPSAADRGLLDELDRRLAERARPFELPLLIRQDPLRALGLVDQAQAVTGLLDVQGLLARLGALAAIALRLGQHERLLSEVDQLLGVVPDSPRLHRHTAALLRELDAPGWRARADALEEQAAALER